MWPTFERAAGTAEAAIVILDGLPLSVVQRLERWRHWQAAPLIVIASRAYPHMSALMRLGGQEFLWLDEAAHRLADALSRTGRDRFFHDLAQALEGARRLSRPLRRALVTAVLAQPPITSVSRVAGAVGVSRSTLWQHWRRCAGGSTELRLEDVLDWLALLRVAQQRTSGVSWSAAARANGLCADTLARRAVRLTALPPSELAGETMAAAANAFAAIVCASFHVDIGEGRLPSWPLQ